MASDSWSLFIYLFKGDKVHQENILLYTVCPLVLTSQLSLGRVLAQSRFPEPHSQGLGRDDSSRPAGRL